jgi:acetyltransferase
MRIIGPNCLGVMNPLIGMNATFASGIAYPGQIAFLSQSGAMCTAVLDWSMRDKIGFSAFVSIGSMADVDWGDLIDYLGNDPDTSSILLYMESIGNPRSFISAARKIALTKPIIVIKAGRTEAAAKAAASHTGSMAGSDDVFDAVLQRVGVLRVDTINELFNMALVLAHQPAPQGPHLTIITNAGGPAVLATDAAAASGAKLSAIDSKTIEQLNTFLPHAWSHSNPVDVLGDASAEIYAKTIEVVAHDPHTDGILVVLSPQDVTDPTATAEVVKAHAQIPNKPILASWMGGPAVEQGVRILNQAGVPTFEYPDSASRTFATMWKHTEDLRLLYETPYLRETGAVSLDRSLFDNALREKRSILTEVESKQVLKAYNIPIVETFTAQNAQEAAAFAEQIGYPVVLKLFSHTITHKTDVGGVKLNLHDKQAVSKAFEEIRSSVHKLAGAEHFNGVTVQKMIKLEGYELIIGSTVDPQFGPVLLFGSGGQLVEIFKDSALALPPLNGTLAKRLMEKTKIYEALKGVRGRAPVDLDRLEEILVNFSRLAIDHPRIKEIDINPLLASPDQMIALDARVVLHDHTVADKDLPHGIIRPYPYQYILSCKLQNDMPLILRPIRPEDEQLMTQFHRDISEKSTRQKYFEFLSLNQRIAHDRLIHVCAVDYDREISLVAECHDPKTQVRKIIGLALLNRLPGTPDAELKMIICDQYQHLGLGTKMLTYLLEIGKKEQVRNVYAQILADNNVLLRMCEKLGFHLESSKLDPSVMTAVLGLYHVL